MKKIILFLPIILMLSCNQEKQNQTTEVMIEEKVTKVAPDSVLRHVVFFSFKEASTPEDVKSVVDAFRDLQNKIDGIEGFEWGTNSSPEGLNQGLTHAFTLTFHSDAARDAYLPHPAHKDFGALLGPHLEKVMVVDYWTRP
ncbi:MAG: Dabb family protein [Algoriphagus sp.]|nr:Dabb family protein [Algoriphagus sp.]